LAESGRALIDALLGEIGRVRWCFCRASAAHFVDWIRRWTSGSVIAEGWVTDFTSREGCFAIAPQHKNIEKQVGGLGFSFLQGNCLEIG
jgi:hypothetical protein